MESDNQILLALGRLEGKVDAMLTRQKYHDEELDRQDQRLRKLEQGRSWLLGAAAVVGSVCSLLASKLGI
tara:strand:- start:163 stop:372 length:210 start_codon:yes stop_codon:yes gene_type:complete